MNVIWTYKNTRVSRLPNERTNEKLFHMHIYYTNMYDVHVVHKRKYNITMFVMVLPLFYYW